MKTLVNFRCSSQSFTCRLVFFIVNICFLSHSLFSQDVAAKPIYSWSGKTEVGLNMINLISKFVPLNFGSSDLQDIAFKYRKYQRTNAFKLDLGGRISGVETNGVRQFIFIGIGVERRRNIWEEKWTYVSSFDFNFSANPSGALVGVARSYGIEYSIHPNIFLSTQTSLFIGAGGDDGPVISFLPPKGLILNIRF